jgi:hypothetical protein
MQDMDRAQGCVIFIGSLNDNGGFVPYGTGFLLSVFHEEIQFDYVVTCHHIIQIFSENKTWIRVNLINGESEVIPISKNLWINDIKNDISILPYHFGRAKYNVTSIIEKNINTLLNRIKTEEEREIRIGDRTFLVGLFTSHYGNIHNIPILRIGYIAALPDENELVYTDTGFVKAYLVETRSIGGLSGSPVFFYDYWCGYNMPWPIPEGLLGSCFLGVMRGRFNIREGTDVVVGDSESDALNSGIGIVTPVEYIINLLNSPQLMEERENIVNKLKKESMYRPTSINPSNQENPKHKEDFTSLLSAAAKKKPQDDET